MDVDMLERLAFAKAAAVAACDHAGVFKASAEEEVEHNPEDRDHEQHGDPGKRLDRVAVLGEHHNYQAYNRADIGDKDYNVIPCHKTMIGVDTAKIVKM